MKSFWYISLLVIVVTGAKAQTPIIHLDTVMLKSYLSTFPDNEKILEANTKLTPPSNYTLDLVRLNAFISQKQNDLNFESKPSYFLMQPLIIGQHLSWEIFILPVKN